MVNKCYSQDVFLVYANGSFQGSYPNGSVVLVYPSVTSLTFDWTGLFDYSYESSDYWKVNGSKSSKYGTIPFTIPGGISTCGEYNVEVVHDGGGGSIRIIRVKTPDINGPRLCQGQSGDFTTDFQGNGTNFNWSGSGGVSISANGNAYMSGSNGIVICTASNQCGSRTEGKFMGVPNEGEINVSGLPYQNTMTPGSNVDLHTWGNSGTSWSTNHGYFNYQPWNQNTSGESIIYTASYGTVNVIYVTQSNSCGLGIKTLVFNINQWGRNSFMASDLEVFPNPTQNTLNVRLSKKDNFDGKNDIPVPEKIALYDKNGSLIRNVDDFELKEMVSNRKVTIDVKDLVPNEYYLHITDKQGNVEKVRVLVGDKN